MRDSTPGVDSTIRSRRTTTNNRPIRLAAARLAVCDLTERRASRPTACQFVNRCAMALTFAALGAIVLSVPDPGDQTRAFPRFELKAYVDYTGSEVLLYHKIQNISLGGICIQSSSVEEQGTVVDLVLNFPELEATIAVKGEVVWANREPPMDMGIRYVDLDDDRKDTLRRYLSLLNAKPSPAKPPA